MAAPLKPLDDSQPEPSPKGWRRSVPAGYRPVLENRRFLRLLPGLLLSRFGDGMGAIGLTWLALELAPPDGRGLLIGLSLAAYVLPGAVSGLLLGRWCARIDSRTLLLTNSLLRAVLLVSIFVLHRTELLTGAGFVLILAASSFFHTWGVGASAALTAHLVDEEHRRAANSLLYSGAQLTLILGPAAAGALAAAVGPDAVLAANGLSFLVLAATVATFGPIGHRHDTSKDLRSMVPGLRALFGNPQIGTLLVLTFVVAVITLPVDVALPVYVAEDLHGSAGTLGLFWTLYGVGGVTGALLAGALRKLPLWPATLAIAFGCGLAVLPLALTTALVPAVIGFALSGLIFAPYPAITTTLLQRDVPKPDMVAAITAWSSLVLIAEPIGAVLGGGLVQSLGPQPTILLSSLCTMAVAIACTFLLIAIRRRTEDH